ncbi:MAG TPA: glycosyltransferase N-terminal domain-containing protein, partial [Hyphomonadaceae bacterium]|nr:glycosyltransferase N-terminal domain-containing protein [Hyphomonadaceae bacterium]
MTASLAIYHLGTRLLEPLAPWIVEQRLKSGKERAERISERFGVTRTPRPSGPLLWLHGASVGESRLLLDVFSALCRKREDLHALVTTQTLTSADMIASAGATNVVHQMAPVDAPGAVDRFLQHWRPDAAVFAEGEIWPNMLAALKRHGLPAALINARMTDKTLASWKRRHASAREIFSTFGFIGAADQATADGLLAATGRRIGTIGNLKTATEVSGPDPAAIASFRNAAGNRRILLAASTHPGEDEFALDAFTEVRMRAPGALLILVPRHPDRGDSIVQLARGRGFTTQLRSNDRSPPGPQIDVLVADTIGELLFWYSAADAVYLGGATAEGIGGHNPVEPTQLGKRVFTGPHGFNFRETFETLERVGALSVGT